jgi:hypothetical protein
MPTNFPTSVDNFTNPTANDSLNLPSHSTQHANANDAIEAVENYLLNGGQGLKLIKSQVIGSAVTSVTVTDAFNSTFTSYRVVIQNTTGSVNDALSYAKFNNSTNYFSGFVGVAIGGAVTSGSVNNTAFGVQIALTSTTSSSSAFDVINPFLATRTQVLSGGFNGNGFACVGASGWTADSNSNTNLIFSIGSGTVTGGTISVYGYGV